MYGAADANYIGKYWRPFNTTPSLAYYDWCIVPHIYNGVELTMGGYSYNDTKSFSTFIAGIKDNGLQFPNDELIFNAKFIMKKIK